MMFQLKRTFIFSFAIILCLSAAAAAQLRLPEASPKASEMVRIGVTDVTVTYNRPGIKGRKVWGDAPTDAGNANKTLDGAASSGGALVTYGHVWRTGANNATTFAVTDDVLINGQPLSAGTYSLHSIPGKSEWTVVFNSVADQWGSFSYDATKDVLRVKVKPAMSSEDQEWMAIDLSPATANTATATIAWEKVRVPFTVEVKDVAATTIARAKSAVSSAKADDWSTAFRAANYAKQNKADKDATVWYEQALKANTEAISTKANFANLSGRANILLALGRRDEAIAAADKAIETGKAEKANTANFEKRFADVKAGKI